MCLWYQGIDHNDSGVSRGRRSQGISGDDRGVVRGQVIHGTSKGSETTTEAAEDIRRAQGIYEDNRGVWGEDEHKEYNNNNRGVGGG